MTKDEALKMAIKALENTKLGDAALGLTPSIILDDTINACKEALERPNNMVAVPLDKLQDMQRRLKALEQPAQEPVYFVQHPNGYGWIDVDKDESLNPFAGKVVLEKYDGLYMSTPVSGSLQIVLSVLENATS
jgi:hypothetical protein